MYTVSSFPVAFQAGLLGDASGRDELLPACTWLRLQLRSRENYPLLASYPRTPNETRSNKIEVIHQYSSLYSFS